LPSISAIVPIPLLAIPIFVNGMAYFVLESSILPVNVCAIRTEFTKIK
jgi:hypothetical protein